jgi:hypothetical protein
MIKRPYIVGLYIRPTPQCCGCGDLPHDPVVDSAGLAHSSRHGAARTVRSVRPRGTRRCTHRQLIGGPCTVCWAPQASSKGGLSAGQSYRKRGALGRRVDERRWELTDDGGVRGEIRRGNRLGAHLGAARAPRDFTTVRRRRRGSGGSSSRAINHGVAAMADGGAGRTATSHRMTKRMSQGVAQASWAPRGRRERAKFSPTVAVSSGAVRGWRGKVKILLARGVPGEKERRRTTKQLAHTHLAAWLKLRGGGVALAPWAWVGQQW